MYFSLVSIKNNDVLLTGIHTITLYIRIKMHIYRSNGLPPSSKISGVILVPGIIIVNIILQSNKKKWWLYIEMYKFLQQFSPKMKNNYNNVIKFIIS